MTNPGVLDMLKGQPYALKFLRKAAQKPQGGYIFFGPDGVGKRTAAILFSAAINQPSFTEDIFSLTHPDIMPLFPFKAEPSARREVWAEELGQERERYVLGKVSPEPHPSWVVSIQRIRELGREMKFPPRVLDFRAGLLFDFDRIRDEGANAFLKTLEEPQPQTVLVLTSSRPFTLPPTIRSRCKLVRFNALPDEVISAKMLDERYAEDDVAAATDVAFGSLKRAYLFLDDRENFISEDVLEYLTRPGRSDFDAVNLCERLSFRVSLEVIAFTFSLVFKWVLRARSGRLPQWNQLATVVNKLYGSISRASLVNNIMQTEKLAGVVGLNPTPSLLLYRYLSSLQFN